MNGETHKFDGKTIEYLAKAGDRIELKLTDGTIMQFDNTDPAVIIPGSNRWVDLDLPERNQ
jgi:hypothetical protein